MIPAPIHLHHQVCCLLFRGGKPTGFLFFTFLSELKRIMQHVIVVFCANVLHGETLAPGTPVNLSHPPSAAGLLCILVS